MKDKETGQHSDHGKKPQEERGKSAEHSQRNKAPGAKPEDDAAEEAEDPAAPKP